MMPHKPSVQLISSSTRSRSTTDYSCIDYLLPKELLSIIKALIVNEMPQ